MQTILSFIPVVRPWVPWCLAAISGLLYVLVGTCLEVLLPYFLNWSGYFHPVTLLGMVMGSGAITIPLFYAPYIPSLVLCSALLYALVLLQYLTVYEQWIWVVPVARFCGIANLSMAVYMMIVTILTGSNGQQRTSLFRIYKTLLPLVVIPQVFLLVVTHPVLGQ